MPFTSVYRFWFEELTPGQWFKKDPLVDQEISSRFKVIHRSASHGELHHWRTDPRGALSEIIILDQFSRNMFRDSPEAFAYDPVALVLSQEAIRRGQDLQLNLTERGFLYMPFMHSESLAIHEEAVTLFSHEGLEDKLDYELKHKAIIERFGRYPHRNKILGRQSTAEELEFLKGPNSSF